MDERWVHVPAGFLERGTTGHDVHAARWSGGSQDGLTIVALHGLGGSHLNWTLLAPILAATEGIGEVWAPDLAGFGLTPLHGRTATVGANTDLATGFVRTVGHGRPVLLMGNSMGGLIGIKIAFRHPPLLAGLVLVDPASPPRLGGAVDPQVLVRFTAFVLPGVGSGWLRRRQRRTSPQDQVIDVMRLVAAVPDELDQEVVADHAHMAARRREMSYAVPAFITAARSVVCHLLLGRRRYWAAVDAVSVPTLLVHGAADRLIQDHSTEVLVSHRPDWAFRSYADLGHIPMLEDAARVAEDITGWLDKVEVPKAATR